MVVRAIEYALGKGGWRVGSLRLMMVFRDLRDLGGVGRWVCGIVC